MVEDKQEGEYPLISCIMPTANRRLFVEQALKYFFEQDYPNKELIVVDDGNELVRDLCEGKAGILYGSLPSRLSIGYKRNLACMMAKGDIICQFDDDDFFGPHRLSIQSEPIRKNEADVTAFRMETILDLATLDAWICSNEMHAALFTHNVRSGTLMYRSSYWESGLNYPDLNTGEDVCFLLDLLKQDARLQQVVDTQSYVCVRHGDNITPMLSKDYAGDGWEKEDIANIIPVEHLSFYQQLSEACYAN